MDNTALLSAVLGLVVAQVLKPGLRVVLNGEDFNPRLLVGSGGMPSSHSATVFALAASLGIERGIGSDVFAIALIVAVIVAYDARGVRQEAGRHAAALNAMGAAQNGGHPYAPEADLESGLVVGRRPSMPPSPSLGERPGSGGALSDRTELLKENIGHTSAEVVGGSLVGILVGILVALANGGFQQPQP